MAEWVKRYTPHPRQFFKFKKELVSMIEDEKLREDCQFAKMSFSDYKIRKKRSYHYLVEDYVGLAFENYAHQWGCREVQIKDMWFAEYYEGANFNWHTHEGSNLSAIIHIEGDHEFSTELYDIDIRTRQGDIIVFPAMLPHRGPLVTRKNHKLVIGINMNMGGSILHDE